MAVDAQAVAERGVGRVDDDAIVVNSERRPMVRIVAQGGRQRSAARGQGDHIALVHDELPVAVFQTGMRLQFA